MMIPVFPKAKPLRTEYIDRFLGLNRSESAKDNEFVDMLNLSSDKFPLLSSRAAREKILEQEGIKAAIAPKLEAGGLSSFTGVAGAEFYYNGEVVERDGGVTILDSEKSLVDFNGIILIFPDRLYYSYIDGGKLKRIEEGYEGVSLTFNSATTESTLEDVITSKITKTGGWDKFKSGDSLVITAGENSTVQVESKYEQADDSKHVSCVVSKIDGNAMYVNCYNRKGVKVKFINGAATGSVARAMPAITKAAVCGNRVFGVSASGEYVYASKLGDFKNWNVFEGLSTDSWFSVVGTEGEFMAIVPYRQSVVLFKQNYIHQIFGDRPQNFSMPKQINRGCIDGGSVTEIDSVLYFLSYDGVYVFSSGEPQKLSYALGRSYTSAVCGTDGRKLYMSADGTDGAELLVYDTHFNVWHKEDDLKALAFVRYNNYLYAFTDAQMLRLGGGTGAVSWSVTTKKITHETFDKKGVNNIYLRVRLNGDLRVLVSADDGGFALCGELTGNGVRRVPVLFRAADSYQIRLEGSGDFVLEAIERKIAAGGRNLGGL